MRREYVRIKKENVFRPLEANRAGPAPVNIDLVFHLYTMKKSNLQR